jgi:NAD(P)H-flavin reductase
VAHLVSFKTAMFDVSRETPNDINPIAGQSVLLWLRSELVKARYSVTEPDTEDWGWYVDVNGESGSYLVGASAEADAAPPIEWIVQVHKHRSLTDKILGRNKMLADDPLSALIERLIRADARIEQVEIARDA